MTTSLVLDFAVKGKRQKGIIYIRDGIALLKCDDPAVAKEIYDSERIKNPHVEWDDKQKGMIEHFPHKTKSEIIKHIQAEIQKLRGK